MNDTASAKRKALCGSPGVSPSPNPKPALFAGSMWAALVLPSLWNPREKSMTVEELQKATRALAMSIRDQIQQFEERAGGVYVDQVSLFHGDEKMGLGKRTVDVNIDAKVRI